MKIAFKMILACFISIVGIAIIYVLFILAYSKITEFKPDPSETLKDNDIGLPVIPAKKTFSVLSWNIGYAGLGKEMDFFYEGGKKVRPGKEQNLKYLEAIKQFLIENDTSDFILLQEVDFKSKRSFKTDQFQVITEQLSGYNAVSATNYKAGFVPTPWLEPMGSVFAGMATFSKYKPEKTYRISTPGEYPFPTRLFMLKRCFVKSTFFIDNNKKLVLFNIHNSAFDDADNLREQELELLQQLIEEEYHKGHYVMVGGDWNQNPPKMKINDIKKYKTKEVWPIPKHFTPEGWKWAYDPVLPTNRDVNTPFMLENTTCSVLDFFLTSPNIEIINTNTIDLEFEDTDHLPVILTFKFL